MYNLQNIREAADDLRYLLNRRYNRKSAIELVGNRWNLNRDERHILYRTIFSYEEIKVRQWNEVYIEDINKKISKYVPDSVKRFNAVYENLSTENSENWSNAVHSCRRILKDLADTIYPPTENIQKEREGKEITIQLDEEHFINRIIEFITQKSESKTYKKIVGSHLRFMEDRLKSILGGSHKGTHKDITDREEANRIVVYTYLLIGDILALV